MKSLILKLAVINSVAAALLLPGTDHGRLGAQASVLRVRVTSPDGRPVWGATVSAWAGPTQSYGRYTDEQGEFVQRLDEGRYRIMVRAAGFREQREIQHIGRLDTITRVFELVPDRTGWLVGAHLGGPARGSFAVGPSYLVDPGLGPNAHAERRGTAFVVAEPGVGAGRLSAGYRVIAGNLASGWSARATLLKRWRSENALYVGGELGGMLVGGIGPRMGVFIPVAGSDRRGLVLFLDLGIGG